ncbi:MAG TPA: ComEA family DNA-binding protein [Actinomycetota bacterium]|nr:ComEA family DNA-binding protein [Actinomycetota bacterium]
MSGESLRDRLSVLSRGELAALGLLLVAVLAGAGFWYVRSLPVPVDVRALRSTGAPVVASPTVGASFIVHVAGEVRRPGVYEFAEGERVIDAIEAAGGPTGRAALDGLNLAAPLADGTQVVVPAVAAAGAPSSAAPGTLGGSELVNLNTATAEQLETLPGIGEVLAQAIVDYRSENGPFATVEQLEDVSGIGPSILENVRDLVTV